MIHRLIIIILLIICFFVSGVSAIDPPNASFSCSPTFGLSPLPITCTDSSTNTPIGWAWYFGDEKYTQPWAVQNSSSGWLGRYGFASTLITNGSVILAGGQSRSGSQNDVWIADQTLVWSRQNTSSSWAKRYYPQITKTNDGGVLLTGGAGAINYNDTWKSFDDGKTWLNITSSAGWSSRYAHSMITLPNGHIILMGGNIGSGVKVNDVWRSTDDGITWIKINSSAGWSARSNINSVALPNGNIILMGGVGTVRQNDTWRSTDEGVTWSLMNSSSGWGATTGGSTYGRYNSRGVGMPDGSVLLLGGNNGLDQNDVWRSTDEGATWVRVNASAGWGIRESFGSSLLPNGSIEVFGGWNLTTYFNDTWIFNPTGSTLQNPTHIYDQPGNYSVTLMDYNIVGYNATTKTDYEIVYGEPIVKFSMQHTYGDGNSFVTLTDQSYNSTSWLWSFTNVTGNNTQIWFSSLQNPTIYIGAGNWSFSLNASTPTAYNISGYQWINITPITSDFSGTPLSGNVSLPISFTDLSTGFPTKYSWYFGDENYTQPWSQVSSSSGWVKRQGLKSILMPDGDILMMGGESLSPTVFHHDVWKSSDSGATWTLQNGSTGDASLNHPFDSDFALAVTKTGNIITTPPFNQTWRSTDKGVTWSKINNSAPSGRLQASAIVTLPNNHIVLMGGENSNIYYNDTRMVWLSTDEGLTWSNITSPIEYWSPREGMAAVAMRNGDIVMMGGGVTFTSEASYITNNETWKSSDEGLTWTLQNSSSGWGPRFYFSAVTMPDDSIVISGGGNGATHNYNDTWRSVDSGVTWTRINESSGYQPRDDYGFVGTSEGDILLFGGYDYYSTTMFNDTWKLSPQGSNLQNPTHQYNNVGNYSISEMITGSWGSDTLTKINYTSIYILIPDFLISPSSVPTGMNFTDISIIQNAASVSWNWSFGDGSLSTLQNPSHTYTTSGTYTVSLNVSNGYSYNTTSQTFSTPVSIFYPSAAQVLWFPGIVSWNATPTLADTCNWSFGDGSTSTSCNVSHQYTIPGSYPVALNVTNGSLYNINQTSVWLMI